MEEKDFEMKYEEDLIKYLERLNVDDRIIENVYNYCEKSRSEAYDDGYDTGRIDGLQEGYSDAFNDGYDEGYRNGLDDAEEQ